MLISFSLVALSSTAHDVKASWLFAASELGYMELGYNNFSEYFSCKVLALSELKYPPRLKTLIFEFFYHFLAVGR